MRNIALILLMIPLLSIAQYKNLEKYTTKNQVELNIGDIVTLGSSTGDNDQFLYVHTLPSLFKPYIIYVKKQCEKRKIKIEGFAVLKDKYQDGLNEPDYYIKFKLGSSKFCINIEKAINCGELLIE